MSEVLEVGLDAAVKAGEILLSYFNSDIEFRSKTGPEIVSDADLEAEECIVSLISKHFPEHSFIGEEKHKTENTQGDLWVIDPLDGTTNFAHGVPHFAVSLGYFEGGEAKAGIVYNPATKELFTAEKGKGAFFKETPISVSNTSVLSESLLATGFHYDRGEIMEHTLSSIRELFQSGIRGIRRAGTASLDLSWVACGRYDGYFEYVLSPWDFAAGALIVKEAGGTISNTQGSEIPVGAKSSIAASNGRIHQALLEVAKKTPQQLTR